MRRFLLLSLLVAACSALAQSHLVFQPGSTTITTTIPAEAPVPGKPYTAHKRMHTERRLPDGTLLTQDFDLTELRDANGLIANIFHQTGSASQSRPTLLEIHYVIDLSARTMLQWNNLSHAADLIHVPAPPLRVSTLAATPPAPEQLGHRIIAGYPATGTRFESQLPGSAVGSSTPLRSVTVVWHSDALDADLERSTTSPQQGTVTITLVDLHEGPADPALFHLPTGYSLHDHPLHAPPAVAADKTPTLADPATLPHMTYSEAMDALDNADRDHDHAALAAQVLMHLCSNRALQPAPQSTAGTPAPPPPLSLEESDKALYAIARHNFYLPAVEATALENVQQSEQALAPGAPAEPFPGGPAAVPPSRTTLRAQHLIARVWDTYGYILTRENKDGIHYLLAAWTLDPLAYYGSHLGLAYESLHMPAEATSVYREALNRPGSPQMKQLLADRLQALAGPAAPPTQAAAPAAPQAVGIILYAAKQPAHPQLFAPAASDNNTSAQQAALNHAASTWHLPDSGPEHITRLVSIDCPTPTSCTTANLPLLSPLPHK